ncbi:hypothetical protein M426DRAFT_23652 [Hypoxylon sp. CI-4A]|nr:hypothetical protein M426DRAFT_23652 [Hypoxylon sp. CI-4A]
MAKNEINSTRFTLFNSLPFEIRREIWILVIDNDIPRPCALTVIKGWPVVYTDIPAPMPVSFEARYIILRNIRTYFSVRNRCRVQIRDFRPELDVLCIGFDNYEEDLLLVPRKFPSSELSSQLRTMAISRSGSEPDLKFTEYLEAFRKCHRRHIRQSYRGRVLVHREIVPVPGGRRGHRFDSSRVRLTDQNGTDDDEGSVVTSVGIKRRHLTPALAAQSAEGGERGSILLDLAGRDGNQSVYKRDTKQDDDLGAQYDLPPVRLAGEGPEQQTYRRLAQQGADGCKSHREQIEQQRHRRFVVGAGFHQREYAGDYAEELEREREREHCMLYRAMQNVEATTVNMTDTEASSAHVPC